MNTVDNYNNEEKMDETYNGTDQENTLEGTIGGEKPRRLFHKFAKVNWLLARYHQKNRRNFGPMGDPHRGQGRILALLKLQPGISQRDLAYLLGMRPQSAGELLAKLEKAGLVERTQSETDKRVINVKLTDAGLAAAEKRVDAPQPFAALTEEEQATLAGYLDRIADSLKVELGEEGEEFGPESGPEGMRGRGMGRGEGRGPGRGGRRGGPGFGPEFGREGGPRGEFRTPGQRRGGMRGWQWMRWEVAGK